MSGLAGFILSGRSRATLVIAAFGALAMVLPPVSIVSGGALALVALRNTVMTTWSVLLLSLTICGGFLWLLTGVPQLVLALLALWLPVMLCASVLRNTTNLALAMLTAGLCAAALVLVMFSMLEDPALMWRTILERMLESPELADDVKQQLAARIDVMSRYMTGAVAAGFMVNIAVCLIIGRVWQARLYNPGGFRAEFLALRLGKVATLIFALLVLLAASLKSELLAGLLLVFLAMYMFQGIAIMHALMDGKRGSIGWLVIFYAAMVIVWQFMALVAIFGMLDTWVDVRRRWRK
jgi:hypothetical protein